MHAQHIKRPDRTTIVSFSESVLKRYLTKAAVSDITDLTHTLRRKVFITALKEYDRKIIDLDQLSDIAGTLWYGLNGYDQIATELGDILFDCMEKSCDICNGGQEPDMKKILTYYEKYKPLALT